MMGNVTRTREGGRQQMAPSEQEILATLTEVFRTHGYEGASLKIISEATGLARASLYHRFPEGKTQMAEAVMNRVQSWLEEEALAPLRDESRSQTERVRAMAAKLDEFYRSGEKSCLLEALSIGEAGSPLRRLARNALDLWAGELTVLIGSAGFGEAEAKWRADRAITLLQGALIVGRVRDDTVVFRRVLAEMPEQLLGD